MHCKYCDIDIETNSKICPICHEKLEDYDENLPKAFPDKIKRKRKHKHFTLINIYILVSVLIFITAVTTNYLTDKTVLWCYILGGVLLYGLILIKNTIMSNYSIGAKVFVQTLSISLLILLTALVTDTYSDKWAYNYAMPVVHMVSVLVLGILVACFIQSDRNNLVSLILFSLLGIIPLILFWTNVLDVLWPSLVDAIFSIGVILATVIFGHKEIKNEFRRKFHI